MMWEPYPSRYNGLFSLLLVQRDFAAMRQINLDLNLSSCRVALRPAVLSAAWIWPSVSRYLDISFGLRGPSPQAFTPFRGGLCSLPGAWGAFNKGNTDGAEGIFGKLRARVGYGPAPGSTQKKALRHTCP